MDDIQFVLTLQGMGLDAESDEDQLRGYRTERYVPGESDWIWILLSSCRMWLKWNWEGIRDAGFTTPEGIRDAILFALYDEIQKIPATEWLQIPHIELSSLIGPAHAYMNLEPQN